MKKAAFLVLMALAACQDDHLNLPQTMSAADQSQCRQSGGVVGPVGGIKDAVCRYPTPDAGKTCTKASDCSEYCAAETKTCAPLTGNYSPRNVLAEDGTMVTEETNF